MKIIFLLLSLSISYVYTNELFLKREYSLTQPFIGSWDTYGSSVITNSYVRLTHNKQSEIGGIFNHNPNHLRDFEIHLNFKVHGNDGSLFGDGLAFWYTNTPIKPGPIFGNQDNFKGLAIFLDTYSNHNGPHHHEHPYISAMVNNGSLHYDHDSDGTHTQIAGCSVNFRNKNHETSISIRYERNVLTINHDINNEGRWIECFSVKDVRLPLGYFFGVSAATGDLSDNHDIISVKVYQLDTEYPTSVDLDDLYKIEPYAALSEPQREHVVDDKPSSIWTVLKAIFYILVVIGCLIGLAVSYYMYKQNQQQRKRLY